VYSLSDVSRVLFYREDQEQDVERIETRYLINDNSVQESTLVSWSVYNHVYRVKTIYLDTPDGTWSRGKSQTKIRLRNYNADMEWWIEAKTNINGETKKQRRRLFPEDIRILFMLVPIAAVTYRRREFESQIASPGVRATIDRNVTVWELPEGPVDQIMHLPGRPIAKATGLILETKVAGPFPRWLPLPKEWPGSKSQFALAALRGQPNDVAPSVMNADLASV
jgi:hypothetical protein